MAEEINNNVLHGDLARNSVNVSYAGARRASWEQARQRWRRENHLYRGEVRWELATGEMEIYLHVRPRNNPDTIHMKLIGPPTQPQRLKGTWLELEILEGQGKYGILMRLVRRGFLSGGGRMVDLAEFAFRLDQKPIKCRWRDLDESEGEVIQGSALEQVLTPNTLVWHVSRCRNLTVVLTGGLMLVSHIYHRGRVHQIGEHCPEVWRTRNRKGGELTSIN